MKTDAAFVHNSTRIITAEEHEQVRREITIKYAVGYAKKPWWKRMLLDLKIWMEVTSILYHRLYSKANNPQVKSP